MLSRWTKAPLFWAVVLGPVLCTPAIAERTVGERVDDSSLATAVKYHLARASGVPAGSINVEVHKGTVQLSGFIHKQAQKSAALAAVHEAEGVVAVKDALILTDVPRSLGQFIDDQTIQAKVKVKIGDILGISTAISVVTHVRNGDVIVAGFVDSAAQRSSVLDAARNVAGVEKVHDRILLRQSG